MRLFESGREIKIEFEESEIHKEQICCKIVKVLDDRLVLDTEDISPYYYQYLYEGREIKVFLYDLHGINIYDSIIISAPAEGAFEVELPAEYKSIQRRQYVRAAIELKMFLTDAKNKRVEAKTIDLAGNGIRFEAKEVLKFGEQYNIMLYLPGNNSITMKGIVIQMKDTKTGEYVLEFTDISEIFRDRIIKLCLNIQSKIIKDRKNSII